jgi:transposase
MGLGPGAVRARTGGARHRTIAARLGRPASTVRGWVRRIVRVADRELAVNRDDFDAGGTIGV